MLINNSYQTKNSYVHIRTIPEKSEETPMSFG